MVTDSPAEPTSTSAPIDSPTIVVNMPALYNHCCKVFNELNDNSVIETIDGAEVRTWTGFTTGVFTELKLATPYYSAVMNKLQAMGCVEQLHRGGGGAPSKWLINYAPSQSHFNSSNDKNRGTASHRDQERQFRRDIISRLSDMDRKIELLEVQVQGLLSAGTSTGMGE